jgi:hypothetical protein
LLKVPFLLRERGGKPCPVIRKNTAAKFLEFSCFYKIRLSNTCESGPPEGAGSSQGFGWEKIMRRFIPVLCVSACAFGVSRLAWAVNPTVTIDEFGKVLFNNTAVTVTPGLKPDPLNANKVTQAYDFSGGGFGGWTDGDLLIFDPFDQGAGGVAQDMLRFETIAGVGTRLFVYSDATAGDPNPAPADVGLPLNFQGNVESVPEQGDETNNWVVYTPTTGKPGFPTNPPVWTYVFISDGFPEPASLSMVALSSLALLRIRRK